jgi:O-antigen ligase
MLSVASARQPGYCGHRVDAINGTMQTALISRIIDPVQLARTVDALVVAIAVSLPWSTSATSILIVLWLIALGPTLNTASLRSVLSTLAGGFPVVLCLFAILGLVWSVAPLAERLDGFQVFLRFLAIPLLLAQFRYSPHGMWVLRGFLVSCAVLLLLSWITKAWPSLWRPVVTPGVPVKEYVVQSGEFLLCAFGLTHWALNALLQHRPRLASGVAVLALLFVANIVFVATSRASIVVFAALLGLLAAQRFSWKGALGVLVGGAVLAGIAWVSSPYLRERILAVSEEINRYQSEGVETSSGYRLGWWKKSLEFVAAAPIAGHGTGATRELFRRAAVNDPSLQDAITDNPHNQTLSIAIQLGLIGVGLLYAMWIAHLLLFRGPGLVAWIGAGLVVQNVVASLFNSQIFYFTPGWLYIFGVGVLGGMMLRGDTGAASQNASAQERGWRHAAGGANE